MLRLSALVDVPKVWLVRIRGAVQETALHFSYQAMEGASASMNTDGTPARRSWVVERSPRSRSNVIVPTLRCILCRSADSC